MSVIILTRLKTASIFTDYLVGHIFVVVGFGVPDRGSTNRISCTKYQPNIVIFGVIPTADWTHF